MGQGLSKGQGQAQIGKQAPSEEMLQTGCQLGVWGQQSC